MCLLTTGTHIHHRIMVSNTYHKIQNNFSNLNGWYAVLFEKKNIKSRTFNNKNRWIFKNKLWSLRSCFLILPPGALSPQGIEDAMKCDVSKHWCTLQWCANRCWFIVHENWTSCLQKTLIIKCRSHAMRQLIGIVVMFMTTGLPL